MLDLDKRKRYLLACSFGPDSMALFDMLLKEKYDFEVAHVNYNLRDESVIETNNLKGFCEKNHITLHIHEVEKGSIKKNVEETCREIRYNFFMECYKGFEGLLVAHNQDDLIETYYLQQKRNCIVMNHGLKKVTTMKDMTVIRPLLGFKKSELLQHCKKTKTPFAIDKSNLDDTYERNRIRHQIVEKMGDHERFLIITEIDRKNSNLEELISDLKTRDLENSGVLACFDDFTLAFALHLVARKANPSIEISMGQVQEIRKVLLSKKPNVKMYIHDNFILVKEYEKVSFKFETREPRFTFRLLKPGKLDTPYFYLDFTNGAKDRNVKPSDYPLTIRKGLPEDEYKIKDYNKTLRRLMIDWKVPQSLRKRYPVIVNKKGKIIYIPRYRANFKPNDSINFYLK